MSKLACGGVVGVEKGAKAREVLGGGDVDGVPYEGDEGGAEGKGG